MEYQSCYYMHNQYGHQCDCACCTYHGPRTPWSDPDDGAPCDACECRSQTIHEMKTLIRWKRNNEFAPVTPEMGTVSGGGFYTPPPPPQQ